MRAERDGEDHRGGNDADEEEQRTGRPVAIAEDHAGEPDPGAGSRAGERLPVQLVPALRDQYVPGFVVIAGRAECLVLALPVFRLIRVAIDLS